MSAVERRSIKVMLVEDHNLVRAGIRAVIDGQSDIQVIAEATEGREAIRLARANCPDVAVGDGALPGMSGVQGAPGNLPPFPPTHGAILPPPAHHEEAAYARSHRAGEICDPEGPDRG